jgi:hypothetical protein
LNEAFDKARAAAMPEIPPPITITEGGEEFCPSMCLKKPDGKNERYLVNKSHQVYGNFTC